MKDSPKISERGRTVQASPIRKLEPFEKDAIKRGIQLYHLNIGQPDIKTPPQFFDALRQFSDPVLAYGFSRGAPAYIESVMSYYHRVGLKQIEEKDILITMGGSEALLFAMMAVTSPGDEIIVFEPFYTNYNGFANMAGIKLIPVQTSAENGYRLPDDTVIEEKISNKTRAILVTSPNNPTGAVLNEDEVRRLENIILKRNLFLLSDEVYREFCYEVSHISFMSRPEIANHVIMTDSISKRFSACGARLGCLVSKNSDVMNTVLKYGQARLCPATLEQAVFVGLATIADQYFIDIKEEYKKRRDLVYEALMDMPDTFCRKPQGAFYMMASFPVEDIEDFCKWLLTDFEMNGSTIMIAPGPGFYVTKGRGQNEARIAYVLNCEDLKKAMAILKQGLITYRDLNSNRNKK